MTDITIPPEALEAAARAFANAGTADDDRDPFAEACLAMLENWPGAKEIGLTYANLSTRILILTLTENHNDKA